MENGRPRNAPLLSLFARNLNEQLYEFDKYWIFFWNLRNQDSQRYARPSGSGLDGLGH
jgi:hypothetical protein